MTETESVNYVGQILEQVDTQGTKEILKWLSSSTTEGKLDKYKVDEYIAKLDKDIGLQLDEILHHPDFQALESSWRSLKSLVDKTDFEKVSLELIHVTKVDLRDDFEDSATIYDSGWYHWIYRRGLGQFGATPVGAIIGNFEFDSSNQDINLLRKLAEVSAMAHAPFIASISPQFFNWKSWEELPKSCRNLSSTISNRASYANWRSFRSEEDARYVGLTLPRVLLRLPYDPKDNAAKGFNYKESYTSHDSYLWGNASFALAGCMAKSFAKFGWLTDIKGPKSGGAVENLAVHTFDSVGKETSKIPTEVLMPDHEELLLAEEGFIALSMRENSDNAAFFSDNSVLQPQRFPDTEEGRLAQRNFTASTKLTYMSLMNRLAHYLKVWQREELGSWKSALDLKNQLNLSLKQWVSAHQEPQLEIRSKRPFYAAGVDVYEIQESPGWYRVKLEATPHIKYDGAYFTLTLISPTKKIDRP